MAIQAFDKLNKNAESDVEVAMRSLPYEQYFGEMRLTEKQKKKRIEMAKKLEDEILFILSLAAVLSQYDMLSEEVLATRFENAYRATIGDLIDTRLNDYIVTMSENLARSTVKNIEDDYYTSYDRSRLISENEANSILNYDDNEMAIVEGKTKKTWLTMKDNRVRKSHRALEGKTIPIDEYFEVGNARMLYPMDYDNAPDECVNCRCSLRYS